MVFFLIGFMGCGKTHWGKIWSDSCGYSFADLDSAVENATGTSIKTIFDTRGENHFRDIETALLRQLATAQNIIVSCGGGTPCYNNNMQWMNKNGITVYLKASPKLLAQRLLNEKQHRPLIKDIQDSDLEAFIMDKLSMREPVYNQATITLDAANIAIETFSLLNKEKKIS